MDPRPILTSHSLPPALQTTSSIPPQHPQFLPQYAAPQQQHQQQQQQPQLPQHIVTPLHTPTKAVFQDDLESNNKRRRTSGAGSRGVSNLTPEQLAKKRANDREAQRAIRERTKNQIDTLQQRIQELTSQKPYQELQDAIRQKELVQAENVEIKRRLSSIQDLIQPLIGTSIKAESTDIQQHGDMRSQINDTNTPPQTLPSSLHPYDSSSVRSSSNASNTPASPSNLRHTPTLSSSSFPPHPSTFPSMSHHYPRHSSSSTTRSQDDKLTLDFLMQTRATPSSAHDRDRTPSTTSPAPLPMDTLTPPHPSNLTDTTNWYTLPIRNCAPTCPLDNLVLDFLASKRREALSGIPTSTLLGPDYPNFSILLQPKPSQMHHQHSSSSSSTTTPPSSLSLPSPLIAATNNDTTSHPISRLFTDMLAAFPNISTLPEHVAILHIMFLVMRYQVCPTPATYDALPTWMHPRASQLTTPHPAWTDYLPWPRMRDRLTAVYPGVPLLDFFIPYTTTVSLNWPYGDQNVLVPASSLIPPNQVAPAAAATAATAAPGMGGVGGEGIMGGGARIPPMQYHSPPNAPHMNNLPSLVQPLPNPSQLTNGHGHGHAHGHSRSTSLNGHIGGSAQNMFGAPQPNNIINANMQSNSNPLGPVPAVSSSTINNNSPSNFAATTNPSQDTAAAPDLVISPAFEAHLFDLRNWSLGPAFRRAHPEIAECCRIRDDEGAKV